MFFCPKARLLRVSVEGRKGHSEKLSFLLLSDGTDATNKPKLNQQQQQLEEEEEEIVAIIDEKQSK